MKRAAWMMSLLIGITVNITAQNLVLNPGLDGFITCPGFGQFSSSYIISWDKPSIASSDYYNFNCPGIQPTVQMPYSGEGYAGIICYNFGTEYREYITGTFSSPLTAGTIYEVEFFVSLNDGYIQAIEEIGAYISTLAPGPFGNVLHINVVPQIENAAGALTDTSAWMQIKGQFVASGGEQYITIGNFHDDAGTTITQPGTSGSYGAYYFVDAVSVTPMNSTSVDHAELSSEPSVNFDNDFLNVLFPAGSSTEFPVKLECYDVTGKIIFKEELNTHEGVYDCSMLNSGLYVVLIKNKNGNLFSGKLLYQKIR